MALTLSLQFSTGRYVAASWSDKNAVEWPPHPARLCLGLLDALHRVGAPKEERQALLWLCKQTPPTIIIPSSSRITETNLDGIYVPQNQLNKESIVAPRKERVFPTVFLDSDQPTVFFHWPEVAPPQEIAVPLATLLTRLPRLGHSSSLIVTSLSEGLPPEDAAWQRLAPLPTDVLSTPEYQLRIPWDGLIESAEAAFDASGRGEELAALISENFQKVQFQSGRGKAIKLPTSQRGRHDPRHQWCGYSQSGDCTVVSTAWDSRPLLLKKESGSSLGLVSIWQVTEAFHRAIIDRWSRTSELGPIPSWLTGHKNSGGNIGPTGPVCHNHLAIFPLAHVDALNPHADGHLMGLGLALPRPELIGETAVDFRIAWRKALSALFGEDGQLELSPADKSWHWVLRPITSPAPPMALQTKRWTKPSRHWASVTPVILDRHPKPHFSKDPQKWEQSCQQIIMESCSRVGLPAPRRISVSSYSLLNGTPPAPAFEAPKMRSGRPARFHIHAALEFAEPVEGPLLLGAGRYRGYGLFMPVLQSLTEVA